MSRIDPST